ncbi:hypothetical protein FQB35_01085 [Crassaminicella thermophila]|uniref:Uncharacterized protein n=1 Tax=Crassaminicella thermophila TaxID=2599308 RepID=A0A5C0SA94_CRATE|nr:hypothetical protein [Crassaminicella thermophila]QEK11071.1 hypothetical protein FQB35_01085 [Crassaminicella thermophila]
MQKRNMGVLFGAFILLALVSGMVTFFIFFQPQREDEKVVEQLTDKVTKENIQEKPLMSIKEILDDADEVYLESSLGSNDIVEINDKDIDKIFSYLKSLDLKLVMESIETTQDTSQYSNYLYAVHIKNKKVKIKVNEKYVIIDDMQGKMQVFETDKEKLASFTKEIESVFMNQYNACELFENPQIIWIEAKDEEKQWILNESGIKNLLEKLYLLSPVDKNEVIGVPSSYPDYDIHIQKDNKVYKIHLINKEVLLLDSSDSYAYYRYDVKLWDYIHKKYSVKFNEKTSEFKRLLKATNILVDDMENIYDFEDDAYYNIEIARWIIQAEKKETKEVKDLGPLLYDIKFTVNGDIIEVKVFEDYIKYNGKNYYSKRIGETIKSGLGV